MLRKRIRRKPCCKLLTESLIDCQSNRLPFHLSKILKVKENAGKILIKQKFSRQSTSSFFINGSIIG